ncbi:uncharacterized protein LOC123684678 [Harmonia axyridis]|uniref:uncharacterized protein LOC123684678 n=1 Tax=Harmonia axyridis TaxID=115357 RepID=UPI001E2792A6|nr:uncharacterized protein LOC123684678 [Harmonia axyridis]
MSPKKQKTIKDYIPESNSTENDVEPLATDSEFGNSLQQELRDAINTMGPDTPHYFSDRISEIEDSSTSGKNPKTNATYNAVECKPAQVELKELYKKKFVPTTDESQSEVDVETVDINNSYNEDVPIVVCPKTLPLVERSTDEKLMNKCHCMNENFVTLRRDLIPQTNNRRTSRLDRHSITKWFKNRASFSKKTNDEQKELPEFYKMCVTQAQDDHSPPRRLVFNLIDELPKPECATIGVNTKPHVCQTKEAKDRKNQRAKSVDGDKNIGDCDIINHRDEVIHHKIKGCRCGIPARVDVYYFDHGNASYLRTTDNPPFIRTEIVADQSEEYNIKFWGEIFGTIHIGISFITSFILQFFRFLLHSVIRPLTIGLLQITSDYFFKPFLATFFNAIIQPPLIFFYNISTSLRDICDPIAEGIGYFIREISILFRSCRLVDVKISKPCDHVRMQNNC